VTRIDLDQAIVAGERLPVTFEALERLREIDQSIGRIGIDGGWALEQIDGCGSTHRFRFDAPEHDERVLVARIDGDAGVERGGRTFRVVLLPEDSPEEVMRIGPILCSASA